jgi:putative peptide zinc metalloprotease protein
MRRAGSLVTLTTAGLVGLGMLGSPASATFGDNFVYATATQQQTTVERSDVMVVANSTNKVDNGNLAKASIDNCTNCRAVAVAFQVVLVAGKPSTVAPGNAALAFNNDCQSCTAIAIAKQILIYSHGATRIDKDAQAEVNQISAQVRAVATSGSDGPTMNSKLAPLFDRLVATVNDGLVDASDGPRSERTRAA